ncbi:SGNH/GDSL hydrolase family protein [Oleispirillum naphthae]|uniref:SGNH/GDSL hydrolase family protein n=1 Tax=Oleispirillum naphthae TaxID=2838853 RepID=UPI0030825DFD
MASRGAFWLLAAAAVLTDAGAARAAAWPDAACRVPLAAVENAQSLARTHARLAAGEALTIVAFGSSSTQGAGASAPAFAYPAQLETLLRRRAGVKARVINHGIGGQTIADMRARLARDVVAAEPDLVVWQVGSNAALRAMPPARFDAMLDAEVRRLREAGMDVILMDPQNAPAVDSRPEAAAIIAGVRAAAERGGVALMPRHRIMEAWAASKSLPGRAVGPDGLHMTDLGYHCLAVLLAEGITGRPLPPKD